MSAEVAILSITVVPKLLHSVLKLIGSQYS